MLNEGFGKKWIEKILGKVDKDQGVANAGKVLGIGNDGQVVPVEQSGGGSSITVDSALNAESTNPVENGVITSALNGKVDKDQGVANAGKVLGIGADGQVVPVEQSGGGSAFTPWTETVKIADIATMVSENKLKIGDILSYQIPLYYLKANNLTGVNIGTVEAPVYVLEGSPSIFNFGTTVRKTIYSITDSSILFTDSSFTDISTNKTTVNIEGTSVELYYTDLVFHEDIIYSITESRFESTHRYELTTGNKASPRILSFHAGAWIGSYVSSGDATITHMS